MKKMKKIVFAFALFLITTVAAQAQGYTTGIGFRGGFSQGLTVKHFIGRHTAVEGLLSTRWRGFHLTGLYEIHANAFETPGLYWYYGGGGHVGIWGGYADHPWFHEDTNNYAVLGIDGILGLEYNIDAIPFNISVDWKPGINIIGHSGFWLSQGALSVRYIF